MQTKSLLTVTNDKGLSFNVKHLEAGDKYGLENCLTLEEDSPETVEFYDASYAGKTEDWRHGQLVSRYYVETILEDLDTFVGLNLDGGVPEWQIDADAMEIVRKWLDSGAGKWTGGRAVLMYREEIPHPEFYCKSCHRPEAKCSENPCPAVLKDRES